MDRNLALEFVRVTEAAAIASARWFGKGDKISADGAAVDAMRSRFNEVDFLGEVMIGEGEKDEAPLLFIGEKVGKGKGPEVDLAVDPLECTTNCAEGKPNSMSVLAAGPKGSLLKAPGTYMDHIVCGPLSKGLIDINKPLKDNLLVVAEAIGKPIDELTVAILDRDRHKEHILVMRELGCRIWLHKHGTIAAGIATCLDDQPIDLMVGIGGAPEAVILAAALKCLGGDIQGVLKPHDTKTRQQAIELGITEGQVFLIDDLAKGDKVMFVATGVTDGPLLEGVNFLGDRIITTSLVMRAKTKTIRFIEANHKVED